LEIQSRKFLLLEIQSRKFLQNSNLNEIIASGMIFLNIIFSRQLGSFEVLFSRPAEVSVAAGDR
jgi:hypothetical protein